MVFFENASPSDLRHLAAKGRKKNHYQNRPLSRMRSPVEPSIRKLQL